MPQLSRVTEQDLRSMARQATTLHLEGGEPLQDAVVKVASSFGHPLTSEHVRRVCEMSYHDTFERSFRGAPAGSKVVSFDPADAQKVASAVRAAQVQTYQDKIAAAETAQATKHMVKAASVSVHIPAASNAFGNAMSSHVHDPEVKKREARDILKEAQQDVKDAVEALEVEFGSIKHAQWGAYRALCLDLEQEVLEGTAPRLALETCSYFMKEAGVSGWVSESVIKDLVNGMLRDGVDFSDKTASVDNFHPNQGHPLCARVLKVGELRTAQRETEVALADLRDSYFRVGRELQNVRYQ